VSWPLVAIKEVAKVVTGKTPSTVDDQNFGGDIPFVTPAELGLEAYVTSTPRTLSAKGASAIKLVPKNAVMVCCIGSLGKMAIAGTPVATNQQINSVIFDENRVDAKYGFYALQLLKPKMEAMAPSTTVAIVNKGNFEAMQIPLPPLPEQKRIAAILDKADAIRRKRQQAIQLANDFLRAVFLDMFGDPVTNSKGWDIRAVKEMAKVTTGNTPPRDKPEYYGDFIEWIKSDNINTPSDFLTVATEYLSEAGCMVGRRVPAGSTLLTCIAGSFDCIGNSAYADREVSFNQQINALTPMSGVNGIFLYALSKYCKKAIQAASTGGMKGMVSKGKLEEVRFICPPESMQQKFAEAFHRYQGLRKGMEHSQDGLSDEFSSISQKAFSGHL
jgi:type I restriction enzyme S subunit